MVQIYFLYYSVAEERLLLSAIEALLSLATPAKITSGRTAREHDDGCTLTACV